MAECRHGLEESFCSDCHPLGEELPSEELPTWSRGKPPLSSEEREWRPANSSYSFVLGDGTSLFDIPKDCREVHIADEDWTPFKRIQQILTQCPNLRTLSAPKSYCERIGASPKLEMLLKSRNVTLRVGYQLLGSGQTKKHADLRSGFEKAKAYLSSLDPLGKRKLAWLGSLGLLEFGIFARYYQLRGEDPISMTALAAKERKHETNIGKWNRAILHFLSPTFPKPDHCISRSLLEFLEKCWEHDITAQELASAPTGITTRPNLVRAILAQRKSRQKRARGRK